MRRLVPLLSLLLLAPLARAEETEDAPALPKIATFDLGRAFDANPRIKEGQRQIDAKYRAEKAEVERVQGEVRLLQEEMGHSPLSRSSPEFRQLVMRAQRKEMELQQKSVQLATKLQADQAMLLKAFFVDLKRAVAEIAKEEGYDLVFQVQTPDLDMEPKAIVRQLNQTALFHASPRFDVTDALIARIESFHARK